MARVFSGIQPTGNLTIGNYLGSLRRFVDYQNQHECFYCVVDLHALTVMPEPKRLREQTIEVATMFVAAGLDPNKANIFLQSHVREHSEMAWLLQCMSYYGELSRMTQFKEKSGNNNESVTIGLFTYPTLMAADILLYDTEIVPVGEDQKQHVELTRDIAERANHHLGEDTFVVPKPIIPKIGGRIMSLKDPESKMSKSNPVDATRINMLDEPKVITKKIMRAVTDSGREVRYDPVEKAGVSNLLVIESLCSGKSIEELEEKYEGKGYGDFKRGVAEAVVETLKPIQQRYHQLRESGEIIDILEQGANNARPVAAKVLKRYQKAVGLITTKS